MMKQVAAHGAHFEAPSTVTPVPYGSAVTGRPAAKNYFFLLRGYSFQRVDKDKVDVGLQGNCHCCNRPGWSNVMRVLNTDDNLLLHSGLKRTDSLVFPVLSPIWVAGELYCPTCYKGEIT